MDIAHFPELNASLNTTTTLLLLLGWVCIRMGRKRAHIVCMASALVTSTLFLASYLYYHKMVGSIHFTHEGWIRPVYFTILLTHTVLAAAVVPMVAATVLPALRRRWDRHKRIARWTLPVWLYVSVTGVLVYLLLYQWFPSSELHRIGR